MTALIVNWSVIRLDLLNLWNNDTCLRRRFNECWHTNKIQEFLLKFKNSGTNIFIFRTLDTILVDSLAKCQDLSQISSSRHLFLVNRWQSKITLLPTAMWYRLNVLQTLTKSSSSPPVLNYIFLFLVHQNVISHLYHHSPFHKFTPYGKSPTRSSFTRTLVCPWMRAPAGILTSTHYSLARTNQPVYGDVGVEKTYKIG